MSGSPANIKIEGYSELRARLKQFDDKVGRKIARTTLGVGLRVAQRAMQSVVPKDVKPSIGTRNGRTSKARYEAKVGVNVGRRFGSTKFKRWAPAIVLGSRFRTRKRLGGRFAYIKNPTQAQLSTGQIAPHPIMGAFAAASGKINSAMNKAFDKAVAKEVAKSQIGK